MKEKYIAQILEALRDRDENQLQYILTFITRFFGSR